MNPNQHGFSHKKYIYRLRLRLLLSVKCPRRFRFRLWIKCSDSGGSGYGSDSSPESLLAQRLRRRLVAQGTSSDSYSGSSFEQNVFQGTSNVFTHTHTEKHTLRQDAPHQHTMHHQPTTRLKADKLAIGSRRSQKQQRGRTAPTADSSAASGHRRHPTFQIPPPAAVTGPDPALDRTRQIMRLRNIFWHDFSPWGTKLGPLGEPDLALRCIKTEEAAAEKLHLDAYGSGDFRQIWRADDDLINT